MRLFLANLLPSSGITTIRMRSLHLRSLHLALSLTVTEGKAPHKLGYTRCFLRCRSDSVILFIHPVKDCLYLSFFLQGRRADKSSLWWLGKAIYLWFAGM